MDLPQLRSFLALAETLHFGHAAERLHLSQPALSTQIRRLEEELGTRLLERTPGKTTLTYAGTLYREEARQVLEMVTMSAQNARLAAEGKIGRLRVGFISTAAAYIVPPLVASFRQAHPHVELELCHYLTAEQIRRVTDGRLDVGFVRLPLGPGSKVAAVRIHREPFKLFLPAAHALASRPHIAISDLDGAAFVTYSRRNAPGYAAALSRALDEAGVHPLVSHEANDMYTLISLVSAGVGVAIAPASLINYRLTDVVVRDLDGIGASEIALIHRIGLDHPAALAFMRLAMAMYVPEHRSG